MGMPCLGPFPFDFHCETLDHANKLNEVDLKLVDLLPQVAYVCLRGTYLLANLIQSFFSHPDVQGLLLGVAPQCQILPG